LPTCSDNKLAEVNTLVKVQRPIIDDVWVVTVVSKLLTIDVQMSLQYTHQTLHTIVTSIYFLFKF